MQCIPVPKAFKNNVDNFVMECLQDETSDMVLSNEDTMHRILDDIKMGYTGSAKRSGESGGGVMSKLDRAKAALEESRKIMTENEVDADDDRPKKKAKKINPKSKVEGAKVDLTDVDRIRGDILASYEKKTLDELKDYLRWNRQILKGSKPVLLIKCIDGHMSGRIGKCPVCIKGKLMLSEKDEGDTVDCNGYFDTETSHRVSCSFSCKSYDAPRLKWFLEKPSDEENEMIDAEENQGDSSAEDTASEMAKSLGVFAELDLNTKEGIKYATKRYIELCREFNVDVPEDGSDAARAVGPLLISDRSLSTQEFCKVLCDKFGIKKTEDEEQKRLEVLSSVCKCHANGSIYSLMSELSTLYRAESNLNAANSYTKVANAVKDLDYEIHVDNVMGLSKGKTKVNGIGKASAEKIKEFLNTGSIVKLEEKRAAQR